MPSSPKHATTTAPIRSACRSHTRYWQVTESLLCLSVLTRPYNAAFMRRPRLICGPRQESFVSGLHPPSSLAALTYTWTTPSSVFSRLQPFLVLLAPLELSVGIAARNTAPFACPSLSIEKPLLAGRIPTSLDASFEGISRAIY